MIKKIKKGDIFYSYASFTTLKYVINDILETNNDDDSAEILYIAECLSCKNHPNCKIAFRLNGQGNLQFSHMLNNFSEQIWHVDITESLSKTIEGATINHIKKRIRELKEQNKYLIKRIKENKLFLQERKIELRQLNKRGKNAKRSN